MVKVYLVWNDSDPGYDATYTLGIFSTREAAEARMAEAGDRDDSGIVELTIDDLVKGKLKATKRGRDWWVTPKEVQRYRLEHRR